MKIIEKIHPKSRKKVFFKESSTLSSTSATIYQAKRKFKIEE
jgi:hypothetical protein